MDVQSPAPRIYIVDDHPSVRHGLALVLAHEQLEVCGEDECALAAINRLDGLEADLALVDLSFDNGNGFDLITALRAHDILALAYSMHEDVANVERSLQAGANGYVSKREDFSILLQGIRDVLAGERYLSPRVTKALAEQAAPRNLDEPRCSQREEQIPQLLGKGCGDSEIARQLSISVRTVETYCTRISEKLALSGKSELRQFAIRTHLAGEK